jgi:lipopolysaccharide/colanic/teichoic acid biosynthesis glycosyltransferase
MESASEHSSETEIASPLRQVPFWKRALDLSLVCLTSPIWLPLVVVIAGWIAVVSPGPIFFRQERIGFGRKRFRIFKFRTMKVAADTCAHDSHVDELMASNRPLTKLDAIGDPRLIPGGAFLRAAGLDELPQIANVIWGEMSIVGPRPCTVHEYGRYSPWQRARADGVPGLTGYWQVNGKNKTTFSEMIAMDLFYVSNASLRLDLFIILKTIPAVWQQVVERKKRPDEASPEALPAIITLKNHD